jgi:hypothetical protein
MTTFRRRKADVLSHWYSLIPNFQTSVQEFYAGIEADLDAMKIPDLERVRVDFAEGGMLSDRRVYLRLIRERLVFDVCAAPFGTSYFFSCRQAEIPTTIKLWHLVVFGLVLLFSVPVAMQLLGTFLGPLLLVLFWIFFVWLCRNAIPMGLTNLDGLLIRTPVIGPLYERFLRRETYYRVDTRLMYLDTVNAVVKKRVETTTGAAGVKVVRFNEYDPVLAEMYRPRIVQTTATPGTEAGI